MRPSRTNLTRPLARAGFFVVEMAKLRNFANWPECVSWTDPAKCARAQIGANQGGTGRIAAR